METRCSQCGEVLHSHANRNWKYFHWHVIYGPYPNPKPHPCELVNMAFERSGEVIRGSDVARFGLAEYLHKDFDRSKYPNQPKGDHGLTDEELGDVLLEVSLPGGKAARVKE